MAALGLSCGTQNAHRGLQAHSCGILVMPFGLLVVACELLVAACIQDLAPGPGIEPGPPALGAQSLSHWTTREVLADTYLFDFFLERRFMIS